MHVLYLSYPLSEQHAPHQSMTALWLARRGARVTFLAWGNDSVPKSWLSECPTLDYQLSRKSGLLSAFAFLLKVVAAARRLKPDVIYVQGAQNCPFALGLALAGGVEHRTIYHTQDYLEPGKHRFYEACERLFARHADVVISNEENRARFMASSYGLKRMPETIRTALPTWWPVPERDEAFRQRLLSQLQLAGSRPPRLIAAGGWYHAERMSPQALDALAMLPENYVLVFNGMAENSDAMRSCVSHLQARHLASRAIMLGPLDFGQLLALYAACDLGLLLYPNNGIGHYYQAPGRLTEYLRCGLPVVASNFPGLELLFSRYRVGATADPYDPSSIAAAIKAVGDRPEEAMQSERRRMIDLAKGDLAYERNAGEVFARVLPQS